MHYTTFLCKITCCSSRLYFTVNAQGMGCHQLLHYPFSPPLQSPRSTQTVLPRFQYCRSLFTIPKTFQPLFPALLPLNIIPGNSLYLHAFHCHCCAETHVPPLILSSTAKPYLLYYLANSTNPKFSWFLFSIVLQ